MSTTQNDPAVLLVGNFLSGQIGNHCVCEDLATNLSNAGLKVITTSHHKPRLRRMADMVSTILRQRRDYGVANVDVYSGLAFGLAEAACAALRSCGKPFVLTLHGGNLPNFSKKWPGRVRRLLRGAHAVTTPSRYLMEEMNMYRDDILLLPNPLEIDQYPFRIREPAAPKLIWLRSFHEIYNPTLAVEVMARLLPDHPKATLTMVGPDKGDGSFQATGELAEQRGLSDRIEFTGGVPKESIPGHLSAADILINTTNIDNTPISVLEAMACGLCVVSTNVGGIPHLVTDQSNGILVQPRDAEAMTQSIAAILRDSSLSSRLSANARQHAEQFDWDNVLPQWIELLRNVGNGN